MFWVACRVQFNFFEKKNVLSCKMGSRKVQKLSYVQFCGPGLTIFDGYFYGICSFHNLVCRYGINHSDIQVMYYGPTLGYVQDPSTRWVLDLFVKSSHVKTMKTYIIDYKIRNIICHWYKTNFLNFWILEIKMEEIIIYGIWRLDYMSWTAQVRAAAAINGHCRHLCVCIWWFFLHFFVFTSL